MIHFAANLNELEFFAQNMQRIAHKTHNIQITKRSEKVLEFLKTKNLSDTEKYYS